MEQARVARPRDYDEVRRILAINEIESVALAAWLEKAGPAALNIPSLWIHGDSLCYSGATLMPVNLDLQGAHAFASMAIREGRRCSSIVGWLPAANDFWRDLEAVWGPARAVRGRQVVMVNNGEPSVEPDARVRVAGAPDFQKFYESSIEMYIEEIGVSPIANDGGNSYRWRTSELISAGNAFIRTDGTEVVFKAELGAVSAAAAQLQGVWVHPDRRGQGIGAAGTAQVLALARQKGVRTLTLAVNDFNRSAVLAYERCGFTQVAEQMVVLF